MSLESSNIDQARRYWWG